MYLAARLFYKILNKISLGLPEFLDRFLTGIFKNDTKILLVSIDGADYSSTLVHFRRQGSSNITA